MKYTKRPVVVEAVQWNGNPDELYGHNIYNLRARSVISEEGNLTVLTVGGSWCPVPLGAYVVIDTAGYPYPCDEQVFHQTHEPYQQLEPRGTDYKTLLKKGEDGACLLNKEAYDKQVGDIIHEHASHVVACLCVPCRRLAELAMGVMNEVSKEAR